MNKQKPWYEKEEEKAELLRQLNERFAFLRDGEIMERDDYKQFLKISESCE